MQGVEPSGHESVHKHAGDRRRACLVQGVPACDRANARRNPVINRHLFFITMSPAIFKHLNLTIQQRAGAKLRIRKEWQFKPDFRILPPHCSPASVYISDFNVQKCRAPHRTGTTVAAGSCTDAELCIYKRKLIL